MPTHTASAGDRTTVLQPTAADPRSRPALTAPVGIEGPPLFAVIPAHNESDEIGRTLTALIQQIPADNVMVACDNCADDTQAIAVAHGVRTMTTADNSDKKAGALNQALRLLLPELPDDGLVLVLDADTAMNGGFVATAYRWLLADPGLGAVGGVFTGRQPRGLLERCQSNEYARYARELERTRRVMVLTGTASLIRASALREVAAARGTALPGQPGDIYDRRALTEDMELTLALLSLGWSLASPAECTVETQLMPTARALHQQRLRWYRGALDNLGTYGFNIVTTRYFLQQFMLLVGSMAMLAYLALTVVDVSFGLLGVNWFWLVVGALFALERTVTCWRNGFRSRLMAAVLIVELGYDVMLQLAFLRALAQFCTGADRAWHHNTSKNASD